MLKHLLILPFLFANLNCAKNNPPPTQDPPPSSIEKEIKNHIPEKPDLENTKRWNNWESEEALLGQVEFEPRYYPHFEVVAVVDKSVGGTHSQSIRVFVNQQLTYVWPVSTGREIVVKATNGERYLASTPVGFYTPTYLTPLHHSSKWDADMPFAVFFKGGIAVHAAAPAYVSLLGNRASGGCVRLEYENAEVFFNLVKKSGKAPVPIIDEKGHYVVDDKGEVELTHGYKTLIVVLGHR